MEIGAFLGISVLISILLKFFLNKSCVPDQRLGSIILCHLQDELSDVIDIKDPDQTPAEERRRRRLAAEAAKFEPDHYL